MICESLCYGIMEWSSMVFMNCVKSPGEGWHWVNTMIRRFPGLPATCAWITSGNIFAWSTCIKILAWQWETWDLLSGTHAQSVCTLVS